MTNLLFEETSSQPVSPSPQRKLPSPTTPYTPSDDEMDEAQPPTPSEPTQPSKMSTVRRPLVASISDGDITIIHAPRPSIGKLASLQDRLLAAKERNSLSQPTKGSQRNPLDKYTNTDMPKVHIADPTATFLHIDINLVVEWENYARGKLLAIPFGTEVYDLDKHSNISDKLLTATTEITQSDNVGISSPIQSDEATRNGNTPTSFLIYNLTNEEINTLMLRRVWSSQAITFRVAELHSPCPDFLFTIKDITTCDDDSILDMIKAIWKGKEVQSMIENIIESFDEESRTDVANNIQAFLNSVHIKRLNFKNKGNIIVPRFNVYAEGAFISDDDTWFHLRESLANLTYATPMQGRGTTIISPSNCGICHGIDHPTGMCEFPERDGWNGPTRKSISEASNQFRDGNRRGFRSTRLTSF